MAKPDRNPVTLPANAPADAPATADAPADVNAPVMVPAKSVVPTVTETTTTNVAYKKKLATPLTYSWTSRKFVSYAQMAEHDALFSEQELLDVRNAKENANARSKAYQAALDAAGIVRPTAENDVTVALTAMFKTIKARKNADGTDKFTDAEARERAALAVGEDWPEE